MPILVVQHIVSRWSKESRGAPGAIARNAVPPALSIPLAAAGAMRSVLHELHFDERNSFEPTSSVTLDANVLPREALCISVGQGTGGAWATYHYAGDCGGAPDRIGTHKTLFAECGDWIRMSANGRFAPAWHGDWWYEKHVVNVGLFATVDTDCFVMGDPTFEFAALGQLW